jgi:hypothetical protein
MNSKDVPSTVESEPLLPTSWHAKSPQDARSKSRPARGLLASFALIVLAAALAGFIALAIDVATEVAGGHGPSIPFPTDLPPPKDGLRNPAYLVRGRQGAVATEVDVCSTIGVDVLKDNGTATDAAIAAALCGISLFCRGRWSIIKLMKPTGLDSRHGELLLVRDRRRWLPHTPASVFARMFDVEVLQLLVASID